MKSKFCIFLKHFARNKYILDELVCTFYEVELGIFFNFMQHFAIKNYEINVIDGEIQIYMNDILAEIGIEPEEILKLNN